MHVTISTSAINAKFDNGTLSRNEVFCACVAIEEKEEKTQGFVHTFQSFVCAVSI